jgi:hypothetical protein
MNKHIFNHAPLLVGLFALLCLSSSVSAEEQVWYLSGDGVPLATMSAVVPTATTLANHDPGRDDNPGLFLVKGGAGMAETDPALYQQWVAAAGSVTVNGSAAFVFWAAMKDYGTPKRGVVEAYLLDCDPTGADCAVIAQGSRDILDWSGGWGFWSHHSVDFGLVNHTVPDGRSLAVRVVVGNASDDDIMFAYDAAGFPSYLTDSAPGDITIDCDFSDWTNGVGTEFMLQDQGGQNDYGSPPRLDLTAVAVSSNRIDTLQILIAFDDTSVFSGTAGTLFDTDMDGNVDYALVAGVDDTDIVLELYACDDTITDGCGSAILTRTYDDSSYCGTTAAGPWDDDTLVEMAVPFADFNSDGGPLLITSLISYAGANLLTAPMDSVFGVDVEDYQASIYFDVNDGTTQIVPAVGTDFVVRRTADPSTVRSAPPHATVTLAPFDDLPGTLGDGQAYYYVVEKEGGMPVSLSAHPNAYDGVVRLGFDDQDPFTAGVDATHSAVSVDVAIIPADGTAHATLSMTPRDSHGELVGAGCDIAIDASALAPGATAGPVTDHRNGNYTVSIVATTTGTGEVVVTVEGITLTDRPTVEFTSP